MSRKPIVLEERRCMYCDTVLVRREYASQTESVTLFLRRAHCNSDCAYKHSRCSITPPMLARVLAILDNAHKNKFVTDIGRTLIRNTLGVAST